jgi:hypothetical protein
VPCCPSYGCSLGQTGPTFTTIAFDDSSLRWLEINTSLPTSKGLPSSLVQLRSAVWTGVTRDTMPLPDSRSAATASLFDHLVSAAEQRDRESDAERVGGFEVDDQLNFTYLLNRQIGRFLALQYPAGIDTGYAV